MSKKAHKSRVTPQAPLITDMDILSYIQYHPWADAETEAHAFEMETTLLREYRRALLIYNREERNQHHDLNTAYFNEEFERAPCDWDWPHRKERYPPEIRDWKREHRMRFDGGQRLSDKKRELVRSIVQPIWEDAKYTLGRARDLLEEVRRGIAIEENIALQMRRNFEIHRDFLLRTTIAIDNGLSAENDKVEYTRCAILNIIDPVLEEQRQSYQDLQEAFYSISGSTDTH